MFPVVNSSHRKKKVVNFSIWKC